MTHPFGYIGIDFGTSNSHFAYCNHTTDPAPEPVRIGRSGSMPTCVLWQNPGEGEKDILACGLEAQNQWVDLDAEERSRMRFAYGFKPDLVQSVQARRDAWAFLHRSFADLTHAGLPRPISHDGYRVVIGVPAEIGAEHRDLTARIAAEAGFGGVECVEEPLGALAFHLHKGDLTPAEAREGVMVIDFGGGTFDVALVNMQGLQEPWGDPVLGGRLFDDLFLQWVLDQNPGLEVSDQETLVVWQKECRGLKEDFSTHWSSAISSKQGRPFGNFKRSIEVGCSKVWLRNPNVEEFEKRARSYRPSHPVRKYLRGLNRPAAGLVLDEPIDLFERIRQVLGRGRSPGQAQGRFARIILTGGSCWWPFMTPLVMEVLGVDKDRIIMSQNPEATIGAGLALYHVLQLRYVDRRAQIKAEKARAQANFAAALHGRMEQYADAVSDAVVNTLMPPIEDAYWTWYKKGGSLSQVEARVSQICKDFENNEASKIVERHRIPLNTDVVRLMRDQLKAFLKNNEIPKEAYDYIPESTRSLDELQAGGGDTLGRIATDVGDTATIVAVLTAVVVFIIAAVKLKIIATMVLVTMANPPLAVAIGALALAASLAGGPKVKEALENAIKSHEFNWATLKILHVAIWESSFRKQLAEGRAEARTQLREAIRKGASAGEPAEKFLEVKANETFGEIIDKVVHDLGVLER